MMGSRQDRWRIDDGLSEIGRLIERDGRMIEDDPRWWIEKGSTDDRDGTDG